MDNDTRDTVKAITASLSRLTGKASGVDFILLALVASHPDKTQFLAEMQAITNAIAQKEGDNSAILHQIALLTNVTPTGTPQDG